MSRPALVALAVALVGCAAEPPSPAPTPPTPPAVTPTAPTGSAPAVKRTLVTRGLRVGPPENLLLDPGFSTAEQGQQGAGGFLGYFTKDFSRYTIETRVDSASPARLGAVAIMLDPKGTDASARSIALVARFGGGKGPFSAELWVASLDPSGSPRAFPADPGFTATLTHPGDSIAVDLSRDPTSSRVASGREWVRYAGRLERDLVGGGLLILTTARPGGVELAAPVVVAAPTLPGPTAWGPRAAERRLRPEERALVVAVGAAERAALGVSVGR